MDIDKVEVTFAESEKPAVELAAGTCLSEALTVLNSPILFGCRTGICGTCMIEVVDEGGGKLHPRTREEEEYLSIFAPNNPKARLACQIRVSGPITVRKLEV